MIRYSNCWEDADVLIEGLKQEPGGTILSIGSGGDNSLSLLTTQPKRLIAFDYNPAQLALIELKVATFRSLTHERMLQFLGFTAWTGPEREACYDHLAPHLSASTTEYWDERMEEIKRGVIHAGKFEHYFRIFRERVLPLVHSRRDVARLLEPKSREEREAFYNRSWDTLRWRLMFRAFFSRAVMGRLGRDASYFNQVDTPVARRILQRTRYALTALPTADNPYVNYILNGTFGSALPHYARPEHFEKIRENLDALELVNGTVGTALAAVDDQFTGMNLSDIFEYMTLDESRREGERLADRLRKGGRVVYWNMLAPRSLSELLPDRFRAEQEESERLFAEDRAFFYQALHVDKGR